MRPRLFLRFSTGPLAALVAGGCAAATNWMKLRSRLASAWIPIFQIPARTRACAPITSPSRRARTVYRFSDGGVVMGAAGPDGISYTAAFRWPKRAPPAAYEVRVYEIVDGEVARETRVPLSVVRAGFPAWLGAGGN